MFRHDPLLALEKQQSPSRIKISRHKEFYVSHPRTFRRLLKKSIRFMSMYLLLSGTIFGVLMGITNFSAYSARLSHWIDPSSIDRITNQMQGVLLNASISVNAAESTDENLSRSVVEEKIAINNPEMVYSRSYSEDVLLANVPSTSIGAATFQVNPYENRVIIPRLGKNIPLIDVDHDPSASFSEMHQIFLEELKSGIVRYPGTAKPGEVGNVFIFGHSSNYPWIQSEYNDVFALLDTLQNGDEIIVYYNQNKYTYIVTDHALVKPGDITALQARDPTKKEISLMTCWPIGTTLERLIIFGELVDDTTPTSPHI